MQDRISYACFSSWVGFETVLLDVKGESLLPLVALLLRHRYL